jgi:hypothetical protein
MPLLPLAIPPGAYRNGTEYQASGRWGDCSLVRWREGTMGPVGGWQLRVDVTTTPPRAALAWSDLSNDARFACGTATALFSVSASGTVTDITPAGLTPGDVDADVNTGFGGGFFGVDYYGTERPDTGNYGEATTWALDNWGQNLLACSVADGVIYEWDLNVANNGVAVTNAPTSNLSMMVTEERFVFALGAGGNPRKVQWCDREVNTTWTPAATNEAGDLELQTAGQIMCGVRTRGQALILTDIDAHTATYQGPPFVYGFQRVGTSCGSISRKAAAAVDTGVFWMGPRGFFVFSGGTVTELPCEVSDYVFNGINSAQQSKIYAVANSQFNEIWWFYPDSGSTENSRYVSYNYKENHWATGVLSRTAGVDRGVFRRPIWFDASGDAYDHEFGLAHGTDAVFATTGPVSLGTGDQVYSVTSMIPDENTQGDVTATFYGKYYPNASETTFGPYTMAAPTSVLMTARQVRMRVDAAVNADWRVGVMRLEARSRGGR